MPATRVTHVWVDTSGKFGDGTEVGILLEWRREQTVHGPRWQGLVVSASTYSTGAGSEWNMRQRWVDAAHIRPAEPPGRLR